MSILNDSGLSSINTVLNLDTFYDAFNIKPGDGMYFEPNKRVKIW